MKKIKLFLLAALIVGAATAFNQPLNGPDYVLVDGQYILKSTAVGSIGDCIRASNVCTYTLKAGHQPMGPDDFTTNPNEQKVFEVYQ